MLLPAKYLFVAHDQRATLPVGDKTCKARTSSTEPVLHGSSENCVEKAALEDATRRVKISATEDEMR